MPRHNRPELAELLRREFATDPPGGFDTISPEIVPVAIVADRIQSARAGILRASGFVDRTPAAGQVHHCALFNPLASGMTVVVERVYCGAHGAQMVFTGVVENGLDTGILPAAASAPGYYLDVPRVQNSNATIHSASAAASLVGGIFRIDGLQGDTVVYDGPIRLKANSSLHVQSGALASSAIFTFVWTEHPIAADVP